jgi:hypothetical protein
MCTQDAKVGEWLPIDDMLWLQDVSGTGLRLNVTFDNIVYYRSCLLEKHLMRLWLLLTTLELVNLLVNPKCHTLPAELYAMYSIQPQTTSSRNKKRYSWSAP